ncbi:MULTISPECIES: 6-phosphofructokinase [Bacillaceae]|uniref:6-phosphofructokinase n=1 Tax=Bacillaceae TaxID=186817 RepID=UPI001E371979|nr:MULTISPECIES: 6-phosphofructokinase [Bacillaceae]MCE4051636.1 6-phosphofructokinase [Bacillus sp. Au-Bac7]MCM3029652.1 6-phosphofructokinase [Niallia sp. MER 6]MDL0437026.1 6-phosphofructokinase [Niallia sp. SS-2023]UPO87178.1 6-phosphofructokinase [Niallia sp. Man26]
MKVGVIVFGSLPAGVKQIVYKLQLHLTPKHELVGMEIEKGTGTARYKELNINSDSPYLSDSMLMMSAYPEDDKWEEIFSAVDTAVVIGNAEAKEKWTSYLADHSSVRSLFVPVSIFNDIEGSETTLGYDTAVNSIVDNILRVKDTINSLKYDNPRLFGFSIDGSPSIKMLEDISSAGDGHFFAPEFGADEMDALKERIEASFTEWNTSSVLVYSAAAHASAIEQVVDHLKVDFKYTEIDEALCMGTNPTAADRILANRLTGGILSWLEQKQETGQLAVQTDEIAFIKK